MLADLASSNLQRQHSLESSVGDMKAFHYVLMNRYEGGLYSVYTAEYLDVLQPVCRASRRVRVGQTGIVSCLPKADNYLMACKDEESHVA